MLHGGEELLRLREGQTQMRDAAVVFLQGDNIGDGGFLAIIITKDALPCDAHEGASLGSHGGEMVQAILPAFADYPQHLPALLF